MSFAARTASQRRKTPCQEMPTKAAKKVPKMARPLTHPLTHPTRPNLPRPMIVIRATRSAVGIAAGLEATMATGPQTPRQKNDLRSGRVLPKLDFTACIAQGRVASCFAGK